ncbi:hypothetical protein [Corynebacterium callunae]|uniref:hypothetical protein n=1 Tax=Corynebacterium callunae TaxID=1721 RepID=UPI001FFEC4D4|nr:hypothetical protein [Corynebacterium callunae]MCK2199169.1 hypothetical protein [Corynebacterium callunae]
MSQYEGLEQVAERLGITPWGLQQRVQQGRFPEPDSFSHVSKVMLWDRQTVQAYFDELDDLIDMKAIVDWIGLEKHQIYYLAKAKVPLPDPVKREGHRVLYDWRDIQEWASHFIEWEED